MTVTVKNIQQKILDKMDQKYKGGATAQRLNQAFGDKDRNQDGFVSESEFKAALREGCGNPLDDKEAEFLFDFWDTLAGTQEAQHAVEIGIAVQDLMNSTPQYGTGFNSGGDGFRKTGAKGNQPSQAGGIFGGGSYEADARNELPPNRGQPSSQPLQDFGQQGQRPRGNQSSIAGGIFGDEAPPPSSRPNGGGGGGNKSNQSSISGGIFGEAAPVSAPAQKARNSNQSSIPGGIFG